jgi:hypothetical protein
MCTAMLFDPADHYEPEETKEEFKKHSKLYERFMRLKQSKMLRFLNKKQDAPEKRSLLAHFFNF